MIMNSPDFRASKDNQNPKVIPNLTIKDKMNIHTIFTPLAESHNVQTPQPNMLGSMKNFQKTLKFFFDSRSLLINNNVTFYELLEWLTNNYNEGGRKSLEEANNIFCSNILVPFSNFLNNTSSLSQYEKNLLITFIINSYLNALIVHAPMNRKYELNGHRKYIFHCLDVAEAAVRRLIPNKNGVKLDDLSFNDIRDMAIHISVELCHDLLEDYHKALKVDSKKVIKANVSFFDFLMSFSLASSHFQDVNDQTDLSKHLFFDMALLVLFLIYLRSEPREIIASQSYTKGGRDSSQRFLMTKIIDVFDNDYYDPKQKDIDRTGLEMYRIKLFGDISSAIDKYSKGIEKFFDSINLKDTQSIAGYFKNIQIQQIAKLRYETILGKLDDNIDNLHSLYVYYLAYIYLYEKMRLYKIVNNNNNRNNNNPDSQSLMEQRIEGKVNKSKGKGIGIKRFLDLYVFNKNIISILKQSLIANPDYYSNLSEFLDKAVLSDEKKKQLTDEVRAAVNAIDSVDPTIDELSENAHKFSEKASYLFNKYFHYFKAAGKKLNEDYLAKILEITYLETVKNLIEVEYYGRENKINSNFLFFRDLELWKENVVIIDNDRNSMIMNFHKILQEKMNAYDIVIWKNGNTEIEIPFWIIEKMNNEENVLQSLEQVLRESLGENVTYIKSTSLNPRGLNHPLIVALNNEVDYNSLNELKKSLYNKFLS